jgi:hypothetical protein
VQGVGDTEITQRLQMSDDEVALAKLRYQAHVASVSHSVVDMYVNEELIAVARGGGIRKALDGALSAQRILVSSQGVVLDPKTGEPITEPDHATQLEAVQTYGTLAKNVRPNSPSVVANIQNNNSNTQNNLIGGGRSFEAQMREAERRHKQEHPEEDKPIDAEFEEMDEEEEPSSGLDDPDAVDEDTDDEDEE